MAHDHDGPHPNGGPNGQPGTSGERAAPEHAASLGGWRPAKLAAGPERASGGMPGRSAFAAFGPGIAEATPAESPFDRSKDCLASLFALGPPSSAPHDPRDGQTHAWGPRLETERLVLHVPVRGDRDAMAVMVADPETFRYSERSAMSGEEAMDRLYRNVGHWALNGWGLFTVREKAGGRFIGEAGFGQFGRSLGALYDGAPEATWTVARWAQGRGYATEAMCAVLNWLEATVRPPRTVCLIHGGNSASLRVADKLGYRPFAPCRYRGYPALMFERQAG